MDAIFAAPIGALLIFLLRVTDVSMSMMRMILAVRGHRLPAALIGFFEVLIWLVAVGSALQHVDSPLHLIGYAAGFAAGNYVGVSLEAHFALGTAVVRAVFPQGLGRGHGTAAAVHLREHGYAVTEMPGRGREGMVDILNVVVQRRRVDDVLHLVRDHDPEAFVTVEEVRTAHNGHLGAVPYIRPAGRKMPFLTRA